MRRSLIVKICVLLTVSFCVPSIGWTDSWQLGPDAGGPHSYFNSGKLLNGSVLVVGGADSLNAEMLSSPFASWSSAGTLGVVRVFAASTILSTGDFLIAGGDDALNSSAVAQSSSEIWSSASNAFANTGNMNSARQAFSLTSLPEGKAIAIGGSQALSSGGGMSSAEIFDAQTGKWSNAASMSRGRLGHSATLLSDCRVLVVGDNPTAEAYNYKLNKFSDVATEKINGNSLQRSYHTATLLPNGKVLIAGGVDASNQQLASAALFDPIANDFASAGSMSVARSQAAATLLSDGRVLVVGGATPSSSVSKSVDLYDPNTNTWSIGPDLPYGVAGAIAETISDGRAIILGGTQEVPPIVTQVFQSSTATVAQPPTIDCSKLEGGGPTGKLNIISTAFTSKGAIMLTILSKLSGKIKVIGTYGKKKVTFGELSTKIKKEVLRTITVKPSNSAKVALKAKKFLSVRMKVTLTPTKGRALSKSATVKIKLS